MGVWSRHLVVDRTLGCISVGIVVTTFSLIDACSDIHTWSLFAKISCSMLAIYLALFHYPRFTTKDRFENLKAQSCWKAFVLWPLTMWSSRVLRLLRSWFSFQFDRMHLQTKWLRIWGSVQKIKATPNRPYQASDWSCCSQQWHLID